MSWKTGSIDIEIVSEIALILTLDLTTSALIWNTPFWNMSWKNPNDLAILLTAKYYAKYERAAVRGSTICVPNSEATKRDFELRYNPPENWRAEVVRWGVDVEMMVRVIVDQVGQIIVNERHEVSNSAPMDVSVMTP